MMNTSKFAELVRQRLELMRVLSASAAQRRTYVTLTAEEAAGYPFSDDGYPVKAYVGFSPDEWDD